MSKKAQYEVQIEGLSAKVTMLDGQLSDLKKTYKEGKAESESRYANDMKQARKPTPPSPCPAMLD